jgi:hypothetical protein
LHLDKFREQRRDLLGLAATHVDEFDAGPMVIHDLPDNAGYKQRSALEREMNFDVWVFDGRHRRIQLDAASRDAQIQQGACDLDSDAGD